MRRRLFRDPRLLHLARLLKADLPVAVGLLECLWHWSRSYTPQGDIGKYSDDLIAAGLHWKGEPSLLIEMLIESQWVDRDEQRRLVLHRKRGRNAH